MSRLMTRIEKANARVVSRITNELVFGTMIAIAAKATTTIKTFMCWLFIRRCSFTSEQSGRLHRQDQRHRRVEGETGDLREGLFAELVGKPATKRADRGAPKPPNPADDHDRECDRQHLEVQAGIDAEKGAADHAAQCRQERAQRENQHGNARGV